MSAAPLVNPAKIVEPYPTNCIGWSRRHWARSLQKLGHEVKLLSGRMVKPFVGGNKNDAASAAISICARC
jgi:hypothetical protein